MIDKFRLHHLDKPFLHGGVKQYKTYTRIATVTSCLNSYILQTKIQNTTITLTLAGDLFWEEFHKGVLWDPSYL